MRAMTSMKTALSIAGTDPSGGAGIHADLKVFAAHRVYGMAAVTAVVAQNTRGVIAVERVSPAMLEAQLEAVFTDIFPDAVKIGMLPDADAIDVVSRMLKKYRPRFVVIDPVMLSSSGHRLLGEGLEGALRGLLFPLATVVTPNVPEVELLCGFAIESKDDMERAARSLAEMTSAGVLVKGGHFPGVREALYEALCEDFLFLGGSGRWLSMPRVPTKNTHGTGCALSSAIAANLALGHSVEASVDLAKRYLFSAISRGLSLGKGKGPIDLGP